MTDNLKIRSMSQSDIEETLEVIGLYNPDHKNSARRDFMKFVSQSPSKHSHYLVAEKDAKIVGCMGFIPDSDEDAEGVYWTTYLYVHPDYYRQGIGTRLSTEIENLLLQLKARKIYLDIGNAEEQPEAIAFHAKQGYIKEGELIDYFREGENKLIFGKKLIYSI